ncbi:retinol-binding protein pinta [Musca domestica]|uniref:Retinol-binding protein pinta n=1 Tax=Musca domestica TaxID=7370 RepID=A0A9J7D2Q9_MUSDO|nr:retinol-binding protein pinta [Musca domestica]
MAQIKPLNAELQKLAIDELGEVPARIADDLQALKLWIQAEPHLRARTDDQFLIQFLRGCKYSLERAKEKIDLFYSLKTKYPSMFGSIDVDDGKFRTIHNMGCYIALPKPLNENGPRIVVFRFSYNAAEYSIDDVFLPGAAMHEVMIYNDPYACINGIIYLVDFELATGSHFLQMTPNFCMKLLSFLEKSMPYRVKHIYYLNTSPAAQQFLKALLLFFSEKLKQRITILGQDKKEWIQHIPAAYLPRDFGGENSSCEEAAREYNKIWDSYKEYFKENSQYGTDEKLRQGQPLDLDGLFGVGGSFRKLAVD